MLLKPPDIKLYNREIHLNAKIRKSFISLVEHLTEKKLNNKQYFKVKIQIDIITDHLQ